ncbi:hypothetical protein WH47_03676 [Habropoda laboriosa]|uniref:Histone-lysine N-methyltransferase SETMAR n=1 Tax=Habropoda laboriosa TaxID=597456 RepID=A0A0L7RIG7_9HYME|nr:hypothetical protein WH47_03676 [Habropoda laboriosa]
MWTEWLFQRDNDPEHSSKLVKTLLMEQIVNFTNETELMRKITKVWSEIPAEFFVRLIESMPPRSHEVIKSKVSSTSY